MKKANDFGTYLTNIREKSGYRSQRQLAIEAGISPATLSRIESGIQKPSPDTLRKLSKYLKDVTYEELMGNAGYIETDTGKHKDNYPVKGMTLKEFLEMDGVPYTKDIIIPKEDLRLWRELLDEVVRERMPKYLAEQKKRKDGNGK